MKKKIDEGTFQNHVERFLKSENVWFLKVWGNGVQRAGIPDLLLCCNGQFVGVELKTEKGKASGLQNFEISRIKNSGGFAFVLKPNEFESFKHFIKCLKSEGIEVKTKYEIFTQ